MGIVGVKMGQNYVPYPSIVLRFISPNFDSVFRFLDRTFLILRTRKVLLFVSSSKFLTTSTRVQGVLPAALACLSIFRLTLVLS